MPLVCYSAYRGYRVRREHGSLINNKTGKIDAETSKFVRPFAKRWKAKTIIQVLLQYRAARYQDLVNLTQQVTVFMTLLLALLLSVLA